MDVIINTDNQEEVIDSNIDEKNDDNVEEDKENNNNTKVKYNEEELIKNFITLPNNKKFLSVVVAGPCSSGKSTLLGHLLHIITNKETKIKSIFEYEIASLKKDQFFYANICDNKKRIKESLITTSVNDHFIETKNYNIILSNTPGSPEYLALTLNATSNKDAMIFVVSGEQEINNTIKEDIQIQEILVSAYVNRIPQLIICLNYMDLINYNEEVYNKVVESMVKILKKIGFKNTQYKFIPVTASIGDNLTSHSNKTPWYKESTLIDLISNIKLKNRKNDLKQNNVLIRDLQDRGSIQNIHTCKLLPNDCNDLSFFNNRDKFYLEGKDKKFEIELKSIYFNVNSFSYIIAFSVVVNSPRIKIDEYTFISKNEVLKFKNVHALVRILHFPLKAKLNTLKPILFSGSIKHKIISIEILDIFEKSTKENLTKNYKIKNELPVGKEALLKIEFNTKGFIDTYSNNKILGSIIIKNEDFVLCAGKIEKTY